MRRLTTVVTVLNDGRGQISEVRVLLHAKGLEGWSDKRQATFHKMLKDYAVGVKRRRL